MQQSANFRTAGSETTRKVEYQDTYEVDGYVFGNRIDLLSKSTKTDTTETTRRTKSDIKIVDTTVYVTERTNDRSRPSLTRSVERSRVFFVGIPVSVTGKLSGTVGADIDYNVNFLNFNGSIRPYVNSGATVFAGIDAFFVKAGVSGSLTFINAEVKAAFNAALNLGSRLITARLDVTENHDLLSGAVSVFATINYLFGSKTFEHTIFSWNGINGRSTIAADSIYFKF